MGSERASGSGDPGYSVRALQGALDESGFLGVGDGWRLGGVDVRGAYMQGPARELEYVRRPSGQPPDDMLAQARAPTVPRPPGYPGQAEERADDMVRNQANRVVYVDDEGWLDSDDEGESTDSGMPRGHSSSSGGSARSRRSGRSLTVVSIAASLQSASGHRLYEAEEDSSWELWIVLGLVVVCSALIGVGCAWVCCLRS